MFQEKKSSLSSDQQKLSWRYTTDTVWRGGLKSGQVGSDKAQAKGTSEDKKSLVKRATDEKKLGQRNREVKAQTKVASEYEYQMKSEEEKNVTTEVKKNPRKSQAKVTSEDKNRKKCCDSKRTTNFMSLKSSVLPLESSSTLDTAGLSLIFCAPCERTFWNAVSYQGRNLDTLEP
jgi:hypothetical protein